MRTAAAQIQKIPAMKHENPNMITLHACQDSESARQLPKAGILRLDCVIPELAVAVIVNRIGFS